jgi:hypothetical protein
VISLAKYLQIKDPSSGVPPNVICKKKGIVKRAAPTHKQRPPILFSDIVFI